MRNTIAPSRAPDTLLSVQRALAALEILADAHEGRGVTDLAGELGVHKSSASRLLATLRAGGLVDVRAGSGRFELGTGFLRLAARVVARLDLPRLAAPFLRDLADRSGESANISVRVGQFRVCLDEVESANPVRMVAGVGHRYPLYAGAPSKVLLASLPAAEVEAILATVAPHTAATRAGRAARLRRELEEIRGAGYAVSFEENVAGASSIAVPVVNHLGVVVASLGVAGVAHRWDRPRMLAFLPAVRDGADEMARLLGRVGPRGPGGKLAGKEA